MKNIEIVKILREISYLIQITEDDPNTIFKVRAYEKAADMIEGLSTSVVEIYNKNGIKGLRDLPSIGSAISSKIEELIKSNKIAYHEELRKKMPIRVSDFINMKGIGPKTVKILYSQIENQEFIRAADSSIRRKNCQTKRLFKNQRRKNTQDNSIIKSR